MSSSGESSKTIRATINDKRAEAFTKWDESYSIVRSEVSDLISCFDAIKAVPNPAFQDLSIKFFSIHLCNYFVFHVRKALISKLSACKCDEVLMNGFSNPSNTPTASVMANLLSYLIDDEAQLEDFVDSYKILYEIRNKYAHGASNETNLSITYDQFKKIFDDTQKLISL